jgi:hypothetical protein
MVWQRLTRFDRSSSTGKVGKTTVQQRPNLKKVVGNSRENRKKLQHIKSLQKKAEVLHSKRLGTSAGPPKIIVRHISADVHSIFS